MSILRSRWARFGAAVVIGGMALAAAWSDGTKLEAQCRPGEFVLCQAGTVGWVYVSPDRSTEWWAYIDGAYDWADQASVGADRWQLGADYLGAPVYPTFAVWKAAVRQRAEAQGRTLIFQRHFVQEEVVQN